MTKAGNEEDRLNPPSPRHGAGPVLELRNVVRDYGSVRAVSDVSLQLAAGEFLTLLGPSGCGKTTLMNMVAGFFPPTSGDILIQGRSVTGLMPHQRDLGMVFQNYALFPHMNVAQNVAFGLEERRIARSEIRDRVNAALAMVKLTGLGDRRTTQLSGGQQQRVALARALVIRPQVLLLDEPLSALDKNLRTQMQIEIKQIQRDAKVAAVFVTHDQNEALSLSDRIAVMSGGCVEQIGTPEEIYAKPSSDFVASFVGEVNRVPVKVLGITPDGIDLSVPGGVRLRAGCTGRSLVPGAAANLFIRPEHIELVDSGTVDNVLDGTVCAHSYQGSFTHIVVQAAAMEPLLVKVPGASIMGRHPIGSKVRLALDLSRATVHRS